MWLYSCEHCWDRASVTVAILHVGFDQRISTDSAGPTYFLPVLIETASIRDVTTTSRLLTPRGWVEIDYLNECRKENSYIMLGGKLTLVLRYVCE